MAYLCIEVGHNNKSHDKLYSKAGLYVNDRFDTFCLVELQHHGKCYNNTGHGIALLDNAR